jgi:uncharacterized protein RhaS with RHS repeats
VESDPIGLAGGVNTYSYVRSDVIRTIDRTGLINWNGIVLSGSGGLGPFGGGSDIYTLMSPCVGGKRTVVKVLGKYSGVGVGSPYSYTGSNVTFRDSRPAPDPNVFNGDYSKVSAGAAFGGGYGYSAIAMGTAGSPWGGGGEAGFDLGVSLSLAGSSEVISSRVEACTCE